MCFTKQRPAGTRGGRSEPAQTWFSLLRSGIPNRDSTRAVCGKRGRSGERGRTAIWWAAYLACEAKTPGRGQQEPSRKIAAKCRRTRGRSRCPSPGSRLRAPLPCRSAKSIACGSFTQHATKPVLRTHARQPLTSARSSARSAAEECVWRGTSQTWSRPARPGASTPASGRVAIGKLDGASVIEE
jgi:hypothetical protein